MLLLDQSKEKFEIFKILLAKSFSDTDLSESDTRSKIIDHLLIHVLGWDERDIKREGHVDSGYYDYIISVPGISLIVEAKKTYVDFSIPSHHKRVTIKSIYNENKEVIDQIRGYAMDCGIQYGLITNGRQFILLKSFNVDGKPWKDNSCIIFNGLDDIEKRFLDFYENLSKYSIVNFGGFKYDLPIKNTEYKTIISTLIDKDKELVRNLLSARITPLIDRIFGEMFNDGEDDKEFIRKCFVENEETKKNKNEIERLFGDYAPKLSGVVPAVNTSNIKKQIRNEITADRPKELGNTPKPIIIIGSKGAGKTTFINHLFKYQNNENDIENHFTVYIDFRKFYEKEKSFDPENIALEIIEEIYTKYEDLELYTLKNLKRIFIKEINRNDASTWLYDKTNDLPAYNKKLSAYLESAQNDKLTYLEKLSKYFLRERRKRLLVIIDNADQFDNKIQEKIFVFAHSLSRKAMCGTVISLREGYYYKWRFSPPFDAYESNVYHITAPKYSDVLQRRIDFALEKMRAKELPQKNDSQPPPDEAINNESILDFLLGLRNSLFSDHNSELINYLNYTTYPDIREGLRVFKSFLISGHTNISEYIDRVDKNRKSAEGKSNKIIPIYEFVKSIGLQNKQYYHSQNSIIHNLFIPSIETIDHFFKIYIIKILFELVDSSGNTGKFISNKELIEKFNLLGYKVNTINFALVELLKLNIINTDEQLSDIEWTTLPNDYNVSITLKGHYYYSELINRFHYLDLMLQDTPIFNKDFFEKIKIAFPLSNEKGKRDLNQRKKNSTRIY